MRIILIPSLILFSIASYSQQSHEMLAQHLISLNAYNQKHPDVFSFQSNQASLSKLSSFSVGVYSERRFMMEELSYYTLAAGLPTTSGNFGFTGNYSGSSVAKQMQVGLSYGRSLGKRIAAGAQFNYYHLQLSGYGNASAVNVEAGLLFYVNEQVTAGVHVSNPTSTNLNKGDEEKLPAVYTAGIGYQPSDKLLISAEFQKQEDHDMGVHAGIQYQFGEKLMARAGFTTTTETYMLGLGVQLQMFRLDAIVSVHPYLGITPGLMLLFNRKGKTK
ncbi:MAG TPA: hypothetical protein VGD33_10405 [Chitinophagaceae bacterium]